MKHIGILAHSADGAALCFLEIVRMSARILGAHEHPEMTMSILPMGPTLPAYERGDLAAVNAYLLQTAQRLADSRCDFFVCPDNTAHIAMDSATAPYPLPGLHIADVVAQEAKASGYKLVGLLGTRWTVEGLSYPAAFARAGVGLLLPKEDDRATVDRTIFEELCLGIISPDSRAKFVSIIEYLQKNGCDSVALGCTEIPLLITPEVSPIPTLDSTGLLAKAAAAVATGRQPLPTWRGGPQ